MMGTCDKSQNRTGKKHHHHHPKAAFCRRFFGWQVFFFGHGGNLKKKKKQKSLSHNRFKKKHGACQRAGNCSLAASKPIRVASPFAKATFQGQLPSWHTWHAMSWGGSRSCLNWTQLCSFMYLKAKKQEIASIQLLLGKLAKTLRKQTENMKQKTSWFHHEGHCIPRLSPKHVSHASLPWHVQHPFSGKLQANGAADAKRATKKTILTFH